MGDVSRRHTEIGRFMQHNTTVTEDGSTYSHTLNRGDTLPVLTVPLFQDGEQVDPDTLTRHEFTMWKGGHELFTKPAKTDGDYVIYEWDEDDTTVKPGTYTGRFRAYQQRDRISFPNTKRGMMIIIHD